MLALLVGNWRLLACGIACALLSYFMYGVGYDRAAQKCESRIMEVESKERKSCADAQAITKSGNDSLQARYADIARKLVAAQRVPARCVSVSKSAGEAKPPTVGTGSVGKLDVSEAWLDQQFANCSRLWNERKTLEEFEERVWKR